MCYVVALGSPRSGIDSVRDQFGRALIPASNHAAQAFEGEFASFLLSCGPCACGAFQAPLSAEEIVRLRRKYEARGWKENRIDRVPVERLKLGGLGRGLLQRIVMAASLAGLTLLVYWDDNHTVPAGPSIHVTPE